MTFREEMQKNREENYKQQKLFENSLFQRLTENDQKSKDQMDFFSKQLFNLTNSNENKLNKMADIVAKQMIDLRENNNQKLNQMREIVDEKLQKTLDARFKNAFDSVGEKLERMQKNLGEMTKLSDGVNSLSRVLTNVKTRGILGEYQLENLLAEILTPEQYAKNIAVKKNSGERVEFAIKMPGKKSEETVWIPIDSKFPLEPYEHFNQAYEENNLEAVKESRKEIARRIKSFAKDISSKYIEPPFTTDFAIMFLPIEGLYNEVMQQTSLTEELRRDFKILIVGPNHFSAFLSSLQVGFKTLAIEKKTVEVWRHLNDFKKDFHKFGGLLEKAQKKIQEAGNVIDDASKRTKIIDKKLNKTENPFSLSEEEKPKIARTTMLEDTNQLF